ncbi:hypothetical protein SAMD00019534_020230 [Acytostelium subglobosum LB1]|uniref:hypothetical protein n=1 Tax=Acytostelium subglobosum LB1 TaxID=1410327 RepID=UPI00064493EA|nr:hypothetical protein SAMD00019534_020230 [Acytostelium subglobosum LB1]GAM18848.1 hypothetical protein SAMD00019534_020230 [Acytostelium subglobosum LB1]|eukprot:XP_012758068.1 hypothetical protein SAMD00019534_020230 [Acytostelium subglobosum LB1]
MTNLPENQLPDHPNGQQEPIPNDIGIQQQPHDLGPIPGDQVMMPQPPKPFNHPAVQADPGQHHLGIRYQYPPSPDYEVDEPVFSPPVPLLFNKQ